jgi:exosortase A-associated hydrolase 2
MTLEYPIYIQREQHRLFGVLHQPTGNAIGQIEIGTVFCGPFTEEKLIAHRPMVNLARKLASNGFTCLRFDYMGHGDSNGDFEDATVESRLSDIRAVNNYLRRECGCKQVVLLGVRFGATLSVLAADKLNEIDWLILIAPILNGKKYIEQCLRSNLTSQIALHGKVIKNRKKLIDELMSGATVNIDGYLLTPEMYRDMCNIDLNVIPDGEKHKALVLGIKRSEKSSNDPDLEAFAKSRGSSGWDVDVSHVKEEIFWNDGRIYQASASGVEDIVTQWIRHNCMR